MGLENARVENDGQKLRGLENAGLENDGKLLANSGQNYGVWKMQRAIPKGRGFVYAYDSQLYRQVKKVGRVRYLKCTIEHCDSSAKLDNGQNHDWGKCSV